MTVSTPYPSKVPVAPPQREPAANPGKLTDTSSRALAQLAQVSDALEAERERDFQPRPFPSLTVVIPVFNEERTILQIVAMVRELDIDKQIVVVDDGSTDGTRELLASLPASADLEIFFHESNQGKGAALQTGFRLAEGEIVIVQDADLEYDPADILKVIEPIRRGEAMVAYGSRYLESHHQNSSWLHRFGNWLLTKLSNTANGQHLTDMETCYKAFRREVLNTLSIEQPRFGFEPEITAKIARRGYHIREIPVQYHARDWREGKKIGLRDLFAALYCIVRYRYFA